MSLLEIPGGVVFVGDELMVGENDSNITGRPCNVGHQPLVFLVLFPGGKIANRLC